jgi:two-component system chemotaxis sensor kinase CheA
MSQSELLDQFLTEARDCLEQVGQRLLDVERDPRNAELLNDLFRLVHTLKGNCGLFDFKALERMVHAGEDLLDSVRGGDLEYTDVIADALLEAMDYASELIDSIEMTGHLPSGCEQRAQALANLLREQLNPASVRVAEAAQAPSANTPAPGWLQRVPPELLARAGAVALRYRPEPECFFKGEDPWNLARSAPGLAYLDTVAAQDWPDPEVFDCYRCNLDMVFVCVAPRANIDEHFRYVPEQVDTWDCAVVESRPAAADATTGLASAAGDAVSNPRVLRKRVAEVWADQVALLSRAGVSAATVASTRRVFLALLACWGPDSHSESIGASMPGPDGPAVTMLGWARRAQPSPNGDWDAAGVEAAELAGAPANLGCDAEGLASLASAPELQQGGDRTPRVLKVGQEKIDRLMDLIGEMVVAKNALPYLATRAEEVFQQRELAREIKAQYAVINRIAEDMQHAIMQVRMLPVGTVFQRFSRLVRDISKKLGKEVELVISGEDTEADKNVIEALADPLIHILRNSLDHGIELPAARLAAGKPARGTLRVEARQEGDHVILEISDDGAGVDTVRVREKAVERGLIPADRATSLTEADAVQLVFLPGFSTSETISDLSGRGVGMDVVRSAVERINGQVAMTSERGRGTTIRLSLPLSMAVTNVMMIEAAGRRFGVPMDLIVETVRINAEDIHVFKSAQTTVLRGRIVPLRSLHRLLALDAAPRPNADGELALLVVRMGAESVGLLVDDFHGTSDIILKPLEGVLAGLTGFAGTALMGDGSVLMILNPKELL